MDRKPGSSSKKKEGVSGQTNIESLVTVMIGKCPSCVLASQIVKALPSVDNLEKKDSLHAALSQMSQESLSERQVNFRLPRKSVHSSEITLEEYVLPGTEHVLLMDKFVRDLPVPIQDKRHYRNSVVGQFKRTPWYIKFHDYVAIKFENFRSWIDFWNEHFKIIEGQHGAAIVAYFLFIRWLLYMNIVIFLLNFFFIVSPQYLFKQVDYLKDDNTTASYVDRGDFNVAFAEVMKKDVDKDYFSAVNEWKENYLTNEDSHDHHVPEHKRINFTSLIKIVAECKVLYHQHIVNDTRAGFLAMFQNLLQGTGTLEPTLLFAGSYPPFNVTPLGHVYNVAFAFICVLFTSFLFCCIMMAFYSSIGIEEAFTAQTQRTDYYSNGVFSGWDYCIEDPKTADQHHYHFVLEIRTNLHEDRTKREYTRRSAQSRMKLFAVRLLVNSIIIMWLFCALYLIYKVSLYQMKQMQKNKLKKPGFHTFFIQFLPSVIIGIFNCMSPIVFDILVSFEKYSAQTRINVSLFRNICLYLSSIIVLLNTIQSNVTCKLKDSCGAGTGTCHSPRCWETYIGQQLFKLTIVDIFVYFAVFFGYDLMQYTITRNFDNTLTQMWGHPFFFLPTEVLAPVFSQTVVWLGVFYSPWLPMVMICKILIIFNIKKFKVLVLCDPTEVSYRASRVNSVFISILFISFFFALMVHSYVVNSIPPSRGCGPYRYFESAIESVPYGMQKSLSFLMSYWFISFATLMLILAMHHYWGVLKSQRDLVRRLKNDLVLQSCDKQFLLRAISNLTQDKAPKQKEDRSKKRREVLYF